MGAQSDALRISRKNIELASEVIRMGAELKQKKLSYDSDDPEKQKIIHAAESELRSSRQRWRVLKGITAGVVVGSGVDWGRDLKLQGLVLDKDSDD